MKLLNQYIEKGLPFDQYLEEISNFEIWEPIMMKGENLKYEISSFGRIRLYDEIINIYKSSNGYDFVLLSDRVLDKKYGIFSIDELVASTFIPIPYEVSKEYDESLNDTEVLSRISVRHKNNNTRENEASNLEWYVEKEKWYDIDFDKETFSEFQISTFGRLRRYMRAYHEYAETNCVKNNKGYISYQLTAKDRSRIHFLIHRKLMCAIYNLSGKESFEVNHINLDKTDNYWKNLEVINHKKNMEHAFMFKKDMNILRGSNNARATIDEKAALRIIELLKEAGGNPRYLSYVKNKSDEEGYDVSPSVIKHIRNKECWQHLSDKYFNKEYFKDAYTNDINEICKTIAKNKYNDIQTLKDLKNIVPWVTQRTISDIRLKLKYTEISDKYFSKEDVKCPAEFSFLGHDKLMDNINNIGKSVLVGENNSASKLSDVDVENICKLLVESKGDRHIISQMQSILKSQGKEISKMTLENIRNKKSWRHISDKYFDDNFFKS